MKKNKLYFILLLLAGAIVLAFGILTLIFIMQFFSIFFGLGAIIFVLLMLRIDKEYKIANMEEKYAKLQSLKEKPYEISKVLLTPNWFESLKSVGYETYIRHEKYHLFYRFVHVGNAKKNSTIIIVAAILDDKVSFESVALAQDLATLEKVVYKKQKFKNRIILQFAKGDFSDEKVNLADKVFYFSQYRVNFVLINAIFDPNLKQIYYLHSNSFSPNPYYAFGIKEMKDIT